MKKKLTHNLGLKLASLVLAFILWFLVVTINNPKDTTSFSNIRVNLINTELLEQENKVYEVLDNTDVVRVTVEAPRNIIAQLRASDIVAEADVSKLTDINTIAISYYVQTGDTVSIEGNHDVVRLSVEDKASKWVKLRHNTIGEVAAEHMIANASPDQTMIEITGPESAVERVSYAKVEIDVSGATTDLSANVEIKLYDQDDNEVKQDNLVKNVDYVHMSVSVLATKDVPIELKVMGVPAEGYMATGVTESTPSEVKIAGVPAALANVNKISIPAEELNLTGATESVSAVINIREYLPDNIRLADNSYNGRIAAVAYVESKVGKTLIIPPQNISIINLPQNFNASMPEDIEGYSLEVEGLAAQIDPLRQAAVNGVVDIAAWMEERELQELAEGVYSIPITFNLSEEIIVKNEVTVQVTIQRKDGQ